MASQCSCPRLAFRKRHSSDFSTAALPLHTSQLRPSHNPHVHSVPLTFPFLPPLTPPPHPTPQDPAPMNGFAQNAERMQRGASAVAMSSFPPSALPVTYALAQQFAVVDRWFASVPGPTQPNRLYFAAATSMGRLHNANASELAAGAQQLLLLVPRWTHLPVGREPSRRWLAESCFTLPARQSPLLSHQHGALQQCHNTKCHTFPHSSFPPSPHIPHSSLQASPCARCLTCCRLTGFRGRATLTTTCPSCWPSRRSGGTCPPASAPWPASTATRGQARCRASLLWNRPTSAAPGGGPATTTPLTTCASGSGC